MVGTNIRIAWMATLVAGAAACAGNPGSSGPLDETERVFDTSVLHEIHIEIPPEHVAALEYDHERRVPCTFTFDGTTLEYVTIRQKGTGSHSGSLSTKPSFSIRFDELVRGQTLHGLDKLILNNAAMDPTLVHEHLGFDLYHRAGIPSRRTAHAVVTVSGMREGPRTYGVYVLVEAVNETLLERHFGEEHDNGNLFEDENAPDFANDPYAMDLKDPDEKGRSYQRLVEFANFINTATDDELLERLHEFIDLDRAIDGFALDLLAQHGDGFWLAAHNYYLYEHPADRRFVMLPHGMDLLFDPIGRSCGVIPDAGALATTLGDRIAGHPALRARVEQAIDRVLDEVWDVAHMEARIDALSALLDASTHAEPAFLADVAAHRASRDALKQLLRDTAEVWRPTAAATCGDGVRSGSELCSSMCDDGNLTSEDGCSAQCLLEYCGDWVVQPGLGEVCEDAAGCNWDCRSIIVCGDGVRDESEPCDDGNLVDGDGCSSACAPECKQESWHGEVYAFCPLAAAHARTRDLCGSLRATPALPRSPEEQEWMLDRARAIAGGAWWIGLDSYAGQWWAGDGSPVTWYHWGEGQPDEPERPATPDMSAQACVLLDTAAGGAWDDRPCAEEHPFVCRRF